MRELSKNVYGTSSLHFWTYFIQNPFVSSVVFLRFSVSRLVARRQYTVSYNA